jgi:hypothetical protein
VASDIDVFGSVGLKTKYDKMLAFEVKGDELIVGDETSKIAGGSISVSLHHGAAENPSIKGIVVVRCAFSDRNLRLRMLLVPTPARLKRACMRPMACLSGCHSLTG